MTSQSNKTVRTFLLIPEDHCTQLVNASVNEHDNHHGSVFLQGRINALHVNVALISRSHVAALEKHTKCRVFSSWKHTDCLIMLILIEVSESTPHLGRQLFQCVVRRLVSRGLTRVAVGEVLPQLRYFSLSAHHVFSQLADPQRQVG